MYQHKRKSFLQQEANKPSNACIMTKLKVCVTGANGFIAGHIVEELLKRGHAVRGTVRDDPESPRHHWLKDLGGDVQLFQADFTQPGSFDEAFAGCDVVFHVAAVVTLVAKDPWRDIIDPNIQGTRNVLESCRKQKVRKIVLTSSASAAWQREKDRKEECRGKLICEEEWAEKINPNRDPYAYQKRECERMIMNEWEGEFASINPSWALGPQQHGHVTTSNDVVKSICTHEYWPFVPQIYYDVVDVRDVAAAHVWAAENKNASGRYFVSRGECHSTADLAKSLNQQHSDLKSSTFSIPRIFMLLGGVVDSRVSSSWLYDFSVPFSVFSHAKIEKAGFEFKYDLAQTLSDTYVSFRKFGICK